MWQCQECGRRFRTVAAAERASMNGCPNCGGVDVDIAADELVRKVQKPRFAMPTGSAVQRGPDGWSEQDQLDLEGQTCE